MPGHGKNGLFERNKKLSLKDKESGWLALALATEFHLKQFYFIYIHQSVCYNSYLPRYEYWFTQSEQRPLQWVHTSLFSSLHSHIGGNLRHCACNWSFMCGCCHCYRYCHLCATDISVSSVYFWMGAMLAQLMRVWRFLYECILVLLVTNERHKRLKHDVYGHA